MRLPVTKTVLMTFRGIALCEKLMKHINPLGE